MSILLTGANGFVGKNIQNHIGFKDELITISTSNKNATKLVKPFFDAVDKTMAKYEFDSIIHTAAVIPISFDTADFNSIFYANALMMDNIFKLAIEKQIKTFIYLSSFGSMRNYKEYKIGDYYTLSKIHGEHVCSMMERLGIRAISLRIPSPYGLYSNKNAVINKFISKAKMDEPIEVFGTGLREQNFVYIKDVVSAIEFFLRNPIPSGVYEVVSPQNTTMIELAETIVNVLKSKSKIILGNQMDPQEDFKPNYDYFSTYNKTGYKTKYTIQDGIVDYINLIEE